MKHFVTADEIRQLAASGERELMLREHTVLTDAAVDAVRLHGIRVVEGSTYSTSEPRPEVVPAPPQAGGLPAPALAGLVRERPTVTPPSPERDAKVQGLSPSRDRPIRGRLHTRLLIGGEWVEAAGGATVPTVDPATNRTIADVSAAQAEDVDRAVRAARAAFPAWRDLDPDKRARLMLRLAELIEDERDYLAQVESHDVGKPIREAALVDLPACWDPWRFFAGAVRTVAGRVLALPHNVARLRPPRADRRRRDDHPVELPAPHRLPQGLGGARRREHGRPEGARSSPRSRASSSAAWRSRPASRRASSTSSPGSARWPARRSSSTPT